MFWFKKFTKFYFPSATGLIKDPRPIEEKERDYKIEEIFKAEIVKWEEKKPEQWRKFPIFDQDKSSSCVAQTIAKLLGIENYLEENLFVLFSAGDIYSQRKNYPDEGMWIKDGMEIGYKLGAVLEQLMPSQKKSEVELNAYRRKRTALMNEIALPGKGGNYLALSLNFDVIAQEIQKGKAICLGARFNSGDWQTGEVITRRNGIYGHAFTGIDFCLWKGEKTIVFDNSWDYNWGFDGQGVLTQSKAEGLIGAWYYEDLKNTWRDSVAIIPKPKYQWQEDLVFGQRNYDISMLQRALMFEELFPIEVPATGYFGNITAKGVYQFQIKYQVAPPEEIENLKGRRVGVKTRGKLNQLFV